MRGPHHHPGPADVRLVALAAVLVGAAGALTVAVSRARLLVGEVALTRWIDDELSGPLGGISRALDVAFTDASAPTVFFVLVPVVAVAWGRLAAVTYFLAGAATGLTKLADVVARPRPTDDLDWGSARFGHGGYPSGHVVYVVLVFGIIAYLATRHVGGRRARRVIVVACIGLITLTAPARLVELDHWPADLVGGYLLAVPALMALIRAHRLAPWWITTRAPAFAWLVDTAPTSGPTEVPGELGDDGLDGRRELVAE